MSFRVDGGVGGFKPECDFWPLKLPGLGIRSEEEGEGEGEGLAVAKEPKLD